MSDHVAIAAYSRLSLLVHRLTNTITFPQFDVSISRSSHRICILDSIFLKYGFNILFLIKKDTVLFFALDHRDAQDIGQLTHVFHLVVLLESHFQLGHALS